MHSQRTDTRTESENEIAEGSGGVKDEENEGKREEEVEKEVEVEMSDLDMMLMSVGEELLSTKKVINTSNTNSSNNTSSSNNGSDMKNIPGGLWTRGVGRRKRCRHTKVKNENGDFNCSDECNVKSENGEDGNDGNNGNEIDAMLMEVVRDERDEKEEEVLKKMRGGLLDPSVALSADALHLAKNDNISDNNTANSNNNNNIASNTIKLKRMLQLLKLSDDNRKDSMGNKQKIFESVKLNSDNTKIIFRNSDGAEAYCYIVWGKNRMGGVKTEGDNEVDIVMRGDEIDGSNNDNTSGSSNENSSDSNGDGDGDGNIHSAVVQSENESFRSTVIQALRLMK